MYIHTCNSQPKHATIQNRVHIQFHSNTIDHDNKYERESMHKHDHSKAIHSEVELYFKQLLISFCLFNFIYLFDMGHFIIVIVCNWSYSLQFNDRNDDDAPTLRVLVSNVSQCSYINDDSFWKFKQFLGNKYRLLFYGQTYIFV